MLLEHVTVGVLIGLYEPCILARSHMQYQIAVM